MNCPYCGEPLNMYEHWEDRDNEDYLTVYEYWQCTGCERTFHRYMDYRLIDKGALTE